MDRISRHSAGDVAVRLETSGSHPCFENVMVFFESCNALQGGLEQLANKSEAVWMKISFSKSEAMVLNWKKGECSLQGRKKSLPQAKVLQCLGVLFMSDSSIDQERDRQIAASFSVMKLLLQSVLAKK